MADHALADLAPIVRSKNAGPYRLTLDVLFNDDETYRAVRDSGSVTAASVAAAYGLAEDSVSSFFAIDMARAIKITLIRPLAQGAPGDGDMYGCQQHVPLMRLRVAMPDGFYPGRP